MNLPEIYSYEDRAIDTVVSVINRAQEMVGTRQTLKQLAGTRNFYASTPKVLLTSIGAPLAVTSEKLIADTIEKTWNLTKIFKYSLMYKGSTKDECMQYFYFEAIFSQPNPAYPVPQATASVFFRVEDKLIGPLESRGKQKVNLYLFEQAKETFEITYRIEGHHTDHDIRYVLLPAGWLLAVIMMKIKMFRRIESYNMF